MPCSLTKAPNNVGGNWRCRLKVSQLTPSLTDKSRKVFCCNDEMRSLRGGRYNGMLRSLTNHPLIVYELANGTALAEQCPEKTALCAL